MHTSSMQRSLRRDSQGSSRYKLPRPYPKDRSTLGDAGLVTSDQGSLKVCGNKKILSGRGDAKIRKLTFSTGRYGNTAMIVSMISRAASKALLPLVSRCGVISTKSKPTSVFRSQVP